MFSGSRDGKILHFDVRRQEPVVGQSLHHTLEVCGLEWSADGSKLASGGDDNLVCVWNNSDLSQPAKVLKGHQAAVKVGVCNIYERGRTVNTDSYWQHFA